MAGWDDPRQKVPPGDAWTIDDGCLKANRGAHITEDLFTKDVFRDFELAWEWKVAPGANSGVKYRIQDRVFLAQHAPGTASKMGQFLGAEPAGRTARSRAGICGGLRIPDARQHAQLRRAVGTSHQAGALYDIVGPSKDVTRPVGEFNESRLVVKGNHVEHWLNGVKVVETDLDSPLAAERIARRWGAGHAGDRRSDQTAAQGLPHLAAKPRRRHLVPQHQNSQAGVAALGAPRPHSRTAALCLAMALAGCRAPRPMTTPILDLTPPPADARIAYGDAPQQFGDLRLPKGAGPFPVAIVIHGGYWRAAYGLDHIGHLCAALTRAGRGHLEPGIPAHRRSRRRLAGHRRGRGARRGILADAGAALSAGFDARGGDRAFGGRATGAVARGAAQDPACAAWFRSPESPICAAPGNWA
jgi:hypothetical protein